MSAEIEKIVKDLRAGSYREGADIIDSVRSALFKAGLIPEELTKRQQLPPFVFNKPERVPAWIYEIDALKIRRGTRNFLARAGMTSIKQLNDLSDNELLNIPGLGKTRLAQIRGGLKEFRERIISQRQRLGIEDETPIVISYPTSR